MIPLWREVQPAETPLITYDGEFPRRLFRYRSVEPSKLDRLIESEIIGEAIYLAGYKQLNDPDEGRFLVKFDGSFEEIVEFWRKALSKTDPTLDPSRREAIALSNAHEVVKSGYTAPDHVVSYTRYILEHLIRVACFTRLPLNYSMWANYAKYTDPVNGAVDHGGLCIEYECNESWRLLNLHPIEYSDAIPELDVVARSELNLVRTIYKKSAEWRCEEEWRIMSTLQAKAPFGPNFDMNSKVRLENGVKGVIFGLATPPAVIDEITTRVRKAKPAITFHRVTRNPATFARQLTELPAPA
jgi:hypothetical protein